MDRDQAAYELDGVSTAEGQDHERAILEPSLTTSSPSKSDTLLRRPTSTLSHRSDFWVSHRVRRVLYHAVTLTSSASDWRTRSGEAADGRIINSCSIVVVCVVVGP